MTETVKATIAALEKNNMDACFLEKKEDVKPYIESLLPEGASIGLGGSQTLKECGLFELFYDKRYRLFDRYAKGLTPQQAEEINISALGSDFYFTSSNAITENGLLYNVDGNANRIAAIAFGPKHVIIVAGINKIVKNLDEAIIRVKEIAAPKNTVRLGCDTYCKESGKCVSLTRDGEMCDGCASSARICCDYLISARQRKRRIRVILVGEKLGY